MRDERETERKRERGEVFPIFRMLSVRAPRLAFLASPLYHKVSRRSWHVILVCNSLCCATHLDSRMLMINWFLYQHLLITFSFCREASARSASRRDCWCCSRTSSAWAVLSSGAGSCSSFFCREASARSASRRDCCSRTPSAWAVLSSRTSFAWARPPPGRAPSFAWRAPSAVAVERRAVAHNARAVESSSFAARARASRT